MNLTNNYNDLIKTPKKPYHTRSQSANKIQQPIPIEKNYNLVPIIQPITQIQDMEKIQLKILLDEKNVENNVWRDKTNHLENHIIALKKDLDSQINTNQKLNDILNQDSIEKAKKTFSPLKNSVKTSESSKY